MYFTRAEKDLIDQLVKDMSPKMAATIRSKLGEPNFLFFPKNDAEKALLAEIYASINARKAGSRGRGSKGPGPRTAANSWDPDRKEAALIALFLNRVPEEYRDKVREALLRNDCQLTSQKDDPEDQALLDEIYELRRQRYQAEEDALWKD